MPCHPPLPLQFPLLPALQTPSLPCHSPPLPLPPPAPSVQSWACAFLFIYFFLLLQIYDIGAKVRLTALRLALQKRGDPKVRWVSWVNLSGVRLGGEEGGRVEESVCACVCVLGVGGGKG